MLDAVAKLAQNILWNVLGVLGHEIDPYALGPDQTRNLFHFIYQGFGRIIEQ